MNKAYNPVGGTPSHPVGCHDILFLQPLRSVTSGHFLLPTCRRRDHERNTGSRPHSATAQAHVSLPPHISTIPTRTTRVGPSLHFARPRLVLALVLPPALTPASELSPHAPMLNTSGYLPSPSTRCSLLQNASGRESKGPPPLPSPWSTLTITCPPSPAAVATRTQAYEAADKESPICQPR
ncbi:hypothetical protein D9619_011054 [Psilocybe cf. subviscida]|uniref:Uncharacterized protein n=1 Tax=Psilocybe cf. subviscida TaxID=2480587 RepID=A0A8H5EZW5_9AGAR|nr:hypothetical protein D9619_011054 [Psilocybe cf. subviscida]